MFCANLVHVWCLSCACSDKVSQFFIVINLVLALSSNSLLECTSTSFVMSYERLEASSDNKTAVLVILTRPKVQQLYLIQFPQSHIHNP